MNEIFLILLFFAAGLFSFLLTYISKKLLERKKVIAVPNNRSSHSDPIPQGGGVSIALCSLLYLIVAYFLNLFPLDILIFLAVPSFIIGLTGFMDDLGHINPFIRLPIHFSAACLALYLLGGLPPILIFGALIDLGFIGDILGVIYIVWLINLYNFMDGIDGLASLEAIFILSFMSFFSYHILVDLDLYVLFGFICFTVFGFLFWNFPRAHILLGDVGSTFLGITIALLSLIIVKENPQLFWSWLILMGVFIVDSTYTLIQRILKGDTFYEAHSFHAYQKIARAIKSHVKTSLLILAVNIFWLAPIAFFVAFGLLEGILGLSIAYLPLFFITFILRAGLQN